LYTTNNTLIEIEQFISFNKKKKEKKLRRFAKRLLFHRFFKVMFRRSGEAFSSGALFLLLTIKNSKKTIKNIKKNFVLFQLQKKIKEIKYASH
jgi:hypothetical protein